MKMAIVLAQEIPKNGFGKESKVSSSKKAAGPYTVSLGYVCLAVVKQTCWFTGH